MKFTVELPGHIFDELMRWAVQEYRNTPQHAAYLLEQCIREREQAQREEPAPVLAAEP
jgi:hypothetical protein